MAEPLSEQRLREIEFLRIEAWALPGKEDDLVDLLAELTKEIRRQRKVMSEIGNVTRMGRGLISDTIRDLLLAENLWNG